MKNKAYYIAKAKKERGLIDEQINYFLNRNPRWDLLPAYANYVKRGFSLADAVEQVAQDFPAPVDPSGVPLVPGDPANCPGNGKGTFVFEDGSKIECCCDNCDYALLCHPEWLGV